MHITNVLAAIAGLAILTTATPTPQAAATSATTTFKVNQVADGVPKFKSGQLEVLKTYRKFNVPVPVDVKVAAAAAATQSGSVAANPENYDINYLCPVRIGTPPQTLNMNLDTGSADLWVFTGRVPRRDRRDRDFWTIKNSTTARRQAGQYWSIRYGDASGASGIVFSDKVVIGGVTATKQAVEAATSVSYSFAADVETDGLVGLSHGSLNTVVPKQVPTFFDTVMPTLAEKVFTSNLKSQAPGSYGFGFIDNTLYSGEIAYTPVTFENGFWEFNMTAFHVGTQRTARTVSVIADTGTTLNYLPSGIAKKYWNQVNGSAISSNYGGYIFPCDADLPDFSITIGKVSHTIPGKYMNYAPLVIGGPQCFGGLQSSDGLGINILGDVFLKSVFAVWDVGRTRIGFADQA